MVFLGAGGTIVMVIGSDAATRNTGTLSGTASSLVNATQQLGAAIGAPPRSPTTHAFGFEAALSGVSVMCVRG